jgi:hypothetical protein
LAEDVDSLVIDLVRVHVQHHLVAEQRSDRRVRDEDVRAARVDDSEILIVDFRNLAERQSTSA